MKKNLLIILMMACCMNILTGQVTTSVQSFLMPVPQHLEVQEGVFTRNSGRIELSANIDDGRLLEEVMNVRQLFHDIGFNWTLTRQCAKGEMPVMKVVINSDLDLPAQGYSLSVTEEQIHLTGKDAGGVFNGLQTMRQLIRYAKRDGGFITLEITDFPDFQNRGFMLDVSRDKVPKLTTLFQMIDQLAAWKVNQLQLYTEHTFAYQNHKKVWQDYSPYSAEDIIKINAYCHQRFIELVPNQNALGHMERWLVHPEYQHMAELEKIDMAGDAHLHRRTTLNPVDPRSMELVTGLFDELLPNFSSQSVNIGGDEPWELGYGRSKAVCDEKGKGEVYISYMSELTNKLKEKGYSPQMWADIVLNYPDQLHRLPEDLTCLVWGYRSWYPFMENCRKLHEAGVPFYVCPGTSSWQSFIGRWPNARQNLLKAAKAGQKYKAQGYLNTDWGDFGHWQPFVISYPAIIYGAGVSWSVMQNEQLDVAASLSNSLFEVENPTLASLIIELGEVYKLYDGDIQKYVNVFYDILRFPDGALSAKKLEHVNAKNTAAVLEQLRILMDRLDACPAYTREQQIIVEELRLAAGFSRHSALMAQERLHLHENKMSLASDAVKERMLNDWNAILSDFNRLWLLRNRSGGLQNSRRGFDAIENCYRLK